MEPHPNLGHPEKALVWPADFPAVPTTLVPHLPRLPAAGRGSASPANPPFSTEQLNELLKTEL